jgi:hypothetical protein
MDNAEASIRAVDVVDIHNMLTWDRHDIPVRGETKVAQRPRYSAKSASGLKIHFEGGVPLPAEQTSGRRIALRVKRAMDIAIGGIALVALAPLLILVADRCCFGRPAKASTESLSRRSSFGQCGWRRGTLPALRKRPRTIHA